MAGVAQEGLARRHRAQHAAFALLPEIAVEATVIGDHAFGKVDVQVVGDDVPFGLVRRAGDQPIEEAGEVVFGASRPDDTAHLAGGDIETGDQGLGTMADVRFPSFDQARLERQRRGCALERLDAGHLVDRDGANPVVRSLPRTGVGRADR